MNHQLPKLRRLFGSMVLISISAAGLLGPSLHALAHFDAAESSGAASSCSCCCTHHSDAPSEEGEGAVSEKHDCAICRYLALSKQVDDCTVAVDVTEDACGDACTVYLFEPCREFSLRSAPRGPPCFA